MGVRGGAHPPKIFFFMYWGGAHPPKFFFFMYLGVRTPPIFAKTPENETIFKTLCYFWQAKIKLIKHVVKDIPKKKKEYQKKKKMAVFFFLILESTKEKWLFYSESLSS